MECNKAGITIHKNIKCTGNVNVFAQNFLELSRNFKDRATNVAASTVNNIIGTILCFPVGMSTESHSQPPNPHGGRWGMGMRQRKSRSLTHYCMFSHISAWDQIMS